MFAHSVNPNKIFGSLVLKKTNIHNVPDIKDTNGKWIKSYCPSSYTQCHTRAGKLWHAVNFRCKIGGLTQNNRPTYLGVTNGFKDGKWIKPPDFIGPNLAPIINNNQPVLFDENFILDTKVS
jgi:hypothetical protein